MVIRRTGTRPDATTRAAAFLRRVRTATGHCFDAFFRSKLAEGVGTRRALQPSAFSECRKINSMWGIPSTRAIAGAKLQSDFLIAIRNP
jgi:hypothetical protein